MNEFLALQEKAPLPGPSFLPSAHKQISPEIGSMAVFIDTEGNCIAIHSREEILTAEISDATFGSTPMITHA
ncbi:hypothetical protein HY285_04190 [Candidatus Peregrinibacteria bacterium]|nr:hypothetical protein [Candidatus Peregrinibacteria bacterium]MBI3816713.1 hypothetical protein [Candidatus Peregrinibacteria bacterium]